MNNKNVLLSVLGGAVAMFLIEYVVYGLALEGFLRNQSLTAGVAKEMPNMVFLFLSNIAFALLLTYVFDRWAGIKSGSGGAAAGTIIGFLSMASFDLMMYATANYMSLTGTIVDIVAFSLISAAVGGLIGWLLGRNAPTA